MHHRGKAAPRAPGNRRLDWKALRFTHTYSLAPYLRQAGASFPLLSLLLVRTEWVFFLLLLLAVPEVFVLGFFVSFLFFLLLSCLVDLRRQTLTLQSRPTSGLGSSCLYLPRAGVTDMQCPPPDILQYELIFYDMSPQNNATCSTTRNGSPFSPSPRALCLDTRGSY